MSAVKVQKFLVDCSKVCFTIGRVLLLSKIPSRLSIQKNSTDIVVLANGPSLTNMYTNHKDFLEGKDVICVNLFPHSELYSLVRPKYLIISGPNLWQENLGEETNNIIQRFFTAVAEKTTWDMVFFIPCEARRWKIWQGILSKNARITVCYYNNTPVEGWTWFKHLLFDLKLGMPRPQNILIPTIYMLIQLRYKRLYLWGVDHSWLGQISVNDQNEALINQKHFYDENESKPLPMHMGGRGKRKLHEILYKFMKTFESYFDLREYADKKNVEILNNTEGSLIDAFTRMKL